MCVQFKGNKLVLTVLHESSLLSSAHYLICYCPLWHSRSTTSPRREPQPMTGTGTWRNIVLLFALAAAWLWVAETRADEISEAKPSHGDVPPTADALPSVLEGRAYYLLADGVTCRANTPERPRLKSWK